MSLSSSTTNTRNDRFSPIILRLKIRTACYLVFMADLSSNEDLNASRTSINNGFISALALQLRKLPLRYYRHSSPL